MNRQNIFLLLLALVISFAPLALKADFAGADDQIKTVISADRPDYIPWVSALWEPPSAEVESLLFSLQAAIGAGFIGYFLGSRRGRKASG